MTEGKTIRPDVVDALLPREPGKSAARKKKPAPKSKVAAVGARKK
jgi:hypothetical protein